MHFSFLLKQSPPGVKHMRPLREQLIPTCPFEPSKSLRPQAPCLRLCKPLPSEWQHLQNQLLDPMDIWTKGKWEVGCHISLQEISGRGSKKKQLPSSNIRHKKQSYKKFCRILRDFPLQVQVHPGTNSVPWGMQERETKEYVAIFLVPPTLEVQFNLNKMRVILMPCLFVTGDPLQHCQVSESSRCTNFKKGKFYFRDTNIFGLSEAVICASSWKSRSYRENQCMSQWLWIHSLLFLFPFLCLQRKQYHLFHLPLPPS